MKAALLQHLTSRQSSAVARGEAQPPGIEAFPTRQWETCFSLLERRNLRVQQRPEEPPSQPTSNLKPQVLQKYSSTLALGFGRNCCSFTTCSCEALPELGVQAGCLPTMISVISSAIFLFFFFFKFLFSLTSNRC